MTVTCLHPHEPESLVEVFTFPDGGAELACPVCDESFVLFEGVLTPVDRLVVAQALADEDRRGWDGERYRPNSDDSYWGSRLDGPR